MRFILFVFFFIMVGLVACYGQGDMVIMQKQNKYSFSVGSHSQDLQRDSIKLLLPTKYNSRREIMPARIAILPYPGDAALSIPGKLIDSIIYFSDGHALAGEPETGYTYFTIDPEAFFYLFWDNEKEHFANRLIKNTNGEIFLEWNLVNYIDKYAGQEILINNLTNLETMYLTCVIDFNENGVIDKEELWSIQLNFR